MTCLEYGYEQMNDRNFSASVNGVWSWQRRVKDERKSRCTLCNGAESGDYLLVVALKTHTEKKERDSPNNGRIA